MDKIETEKKVERIDLTPECLKHLEFLKTEIRIAEQKRQAVQEITGKFVNLCAIELKVPVGWVFNEELNAFLRTVKKVI